MDNSSQSFQHEMVSNFVPQAKYTKPILHINNYDNLLKAVKRVDNRYSHLVTDPKTARKLRTFLNKLTKRLNNFRIKTKKTYMLPYNDYKDHINTLMKYLQGAKQNLSKIVKQEQIQRKKKLIERLKKLTHQICQNINIPDIPVPKEAEKMSMSHMQQIKIIRGYAVLEKRRLIIKPIGNYMINTQTGEIEGSAILKHFTFHGTKDQYKQLLKLLKPIKDAKLPFKADYLL